MHRGDSYRTIVANRDFRGLWLGQTLFHLGQAVFYVAVALYVYELTGSAQDLSFAVALLLLPHVVIGPLAGLLADRLGRKGVLVAAYLFQAGLVALLPLASTLGQVYLLVFASNLMAPVAEIVRAAALPAVAGPQLIVQGSSLSIVSFNAVNVVGPLLGGWAVTLAGARPTFFVVVGCLGAAALFTLRATIPKTVREPPPSFRPGQLWGDMRQALRFLLRSPVLRYLVLLNCVSSLGWSAPDMAMVVYVTDQLDLSGGEYGLLRGTVFFSTALGVFLLGRRSRTPPRQLMVAGGLILAALAYFPILLRPGFPALLAMWFLCGIGWSGNWLADETLWAHATTEEVRGRVYSLGHAIITLAETGLALFGGWLVETRGPVEALCLMGAIMIGGTLLVSAASSGYQAIAGLDRRSGGPAGSPE